MEQTTTRSFAQEVELFKATVQKVCPEYEVNSLNKPLLNEIYKYAIGIPGMFDQKKGLWLWGEVDTGKSTMMNILAEFDRAINPRFTGGFKCVNTSTIAALYAANGVEALDVYTYNDTSRGSNPITFGFDEIGREPIPSNHYGNNLNVMQYIFQIRYELRTRCKTHVTTNMKPSAIGIVYGKYIESRITEMFNIVEVNDLHHRK